MLSEILGWSYFLAWSLSFYPQILLNYHKKSCKGLSQDFVILNFFGFLCYSTYTFVFYFIPIIRREYKDRFGVENAVQLNDVIFAGHALLMTSVTLGQSLIYPSLKPTMVLRVFIAVAFAGLIALLTFQQVQWIDLLYFLSGIKMAISILKYIPQVICNYTQKSTVGWSIGNILLDLTGGMLSLLQSIVDALLIGDWSAITGNWVKFGMGMTSILFDVVFIIQHYVLYSHNPVESTPLLPDEDQVSLDGELDESR